MWPKSCISATQSPTSLGQPGPGPIENTFYTITNCNEIDLSRTNARRSRNPHKFWHTRDGARLVGFWAETGAGSEAGTGFCNLPQFLVRSLPTIYIHIRLITGQPSLSPSHAARTFYLTLLSPWIMRIALCHKHHSSCRMFVSRFGAHFIISCIKFHKICMFVCLWLLSQCGCGPVGRKFSSSGSDGIAAATATATTTSDAHKVCRVIGEERGSPTWRFSKISTKKEQIVEYNIRIPNSDH